MQEETHTKTNKQQMPEWQKYALLLLSRWYFLLAGLIIGGAAGFIKNRYSVNIYQINAQLISKKGEDDNNLTVNQRGGLRVRNTRDTRRERASLISDRNMQSALSKLDFSVSYFIQGDIRTTELYPEKPFLVFYDSLADNLPYGVPFYVEIAGGNCRISTENLSLAGQISPASALLGDTVWIGQTAVRIQVRNEAMNPKAKYYFSFNNKIAQAEAYKNRLLINWHDVSSALVDVSMQSVLPAKDLDFLSAYFSSMVANNLIEKYESASNAIKFLDAQAARLRDTLFFIDTKIDRLRLKNKKAVKGTDAIFAELDSLERIDAALAFENEYYDFIRKYVESTKPEDVFAPNIIGLGDELLNSFMQEYIKLKFDARLYKSDGNIQNPLIQQEDRKAKRLEENIFENISNLKFKNDNTRNDIAKRISRLHESIPGLQIVSNEVKELLRFSKLYENLLSIMQQKKLEAELSIAQTTPDYELIDSAKLNPLPVAPDRKKNLFTWLFIGLAIPAGIIAGLAYFDPRVRSRDDILAALDFPIVGTIWHNNSGSNLVAVAAPRSMITESFRSIRAKLKYYLPAESKCHVILVTSSISGEGKSFCSANLGSLYAMSGQRTLLIGADLRMPALGQYFPGSQTKGLSAYLSGQAGSEELVNETGISNYFFIHAGEVPPNPFELLSGPKMKELLAEMRDKFDKIIIDTPPLLLVSDSLPLAEMADVNLLLVREKRSHKSSLKSIAELQESSQIARFTIVYNDVKPSRTPYGYGYGYGYGKNAGYYG
jgi:capsular exopolysaccharide synthesis family protein